MGLSVPMENRDKQKALEHAKSAQVQAEANLEKTEEFFRLLVDAVDEYAIFALDVSGNILTWNAGGERLKGYKAHEVIGSHFSRFYTQTDIDRHHPDYELKQAVQNGKYEEEGWRVKKNGDQFWANVVITALKDPSGKLRGFAKVTRNLTDRKRAEDELRASYLDLESKVAERTKELLLAKDSAEKAVKSRDEFFSIASHELKTPLSSLKLQTQIRKRNIEKGRVNTFTPENILEQCIEDERQIEKLTFLVENMMDVSHLTSGRFELFFESIDLKEIAEDAISRMSPILAESGNTVHLTSPESIIGQWDRHRLEQVLTNLLSNAGKYAPQTIVEVQIEKKDRQAVIIVKDHGPGIEPINQERIFSPFERVKNKSETRGLGLGLYITKQILEAHHGDIYLDSDFSKGAMFVIDLPIQTKIPNGEE